MKKIRLLALLLALLMIPFGMLFACDDDEDVADPDEEEEEEEEEEESVGVQKAPAKTVDDGKSTGAFLNLFNFDKADFGNLGIREPSINGSDMSLVDLKPTKPYYDYFKASNAVGGVYTVKERSEGNKYLSIQRTGGNSSAVALDFKLSEVNVGTYEYIIQFDVDYGKGLFKANGVINGMKGNVAQNFITFADDAIYDCNGNKIYGEKETDKRGWITVAIVVNDMDRKYDVYIDSGDGNGFVRQTFNVEFNTAEDLYKSWSSASQTEAYRFAISASNSLDTSFRIDNLGVKVGSNIDSEYSDAEIVYTDTLDSKYAMLIPSVTGLKSFLADQPHITVGLKQDLFSMSTVMLSDRITVSKINYKNEKFSDVEAFFDEPVFVRTLTSDEKKNPENKVNKFVFDTKNNEVYFYKTLTSELPIKGIYTVDEENSTNIKFTWINYDIGIKGAKFVNNKLTAYSDESLTKIAATYVFNYTDNNGVVDKILDYGVVLGKYSEVSNLVGEDGTYTVLFNTKEVTFTPKEGTEVKYTYSVANGVITFDFGNETVKYGKYADKKLTVYSDIKCTDDVKLGEYILEAPADVERDTLRANEKYGIKFTNFENIQTENQTENKTIVFTEWDDKWYAMTSKNLSGLKFGLYVSDEMYNAKDEFSIVFKKGDVETLKYVIKPGDKSEIIDEDKVITYVKGLNEFEIDLTSSYSAVVGWTELCFTFSEKTTQPFYITEFEWIVKDIVVEVAGPDEENLDCNHEDDLGNSLLDVDPPTLVAGNCRHAEYYIKKCSKCGAEQVDTSNIGYITDKHVFDGKEIVVEPTCTEDGYTYKVCSVCKEKYIYNIKVAEGHHEIPIITIGKEVTLACKDCPFGRSITIHTEMMSYDEKIVELGITASDRATWNIADDSKLDLYDDGGLASGVSAVMKSTNKDFTHMYAANTDYGKMLLIEGGKNTCETYIDIVPGAVNTNTFFKGQSFVYEFDYMKGKSATGKYPNMHAGLGWREGPIKYDKWGTLYINDKGNIQLADYGHNGKANDFGDTKEYVTEQGVLYNIAVHHNLATNTVTLYINGEEYNKCQFLDSVDDSLTFGVTHIRFWTEGVPNGSQIYIDNYMHYAAEKEPVCIIENKYTPGIEEGEIPLEDELHNTMLKDFSIIKGGRDAEMLISSELVSGLKKQKYTLEFTLNGSDLKAGTILQGKKIGKGYPRYGNLLSTDGNGNLYVLGVLVHKGGTEDVKIALAFDDNLGFLKVYVNGEAISKTVEYTDDFALDDGIIRSFIFLNDCGDYSVKGVTMYTGNDVQQ